MQDEKVKVTSTPMPPRSERVDTSQQTQPTVPEFTGALSGTTSSQGMQTSFQTSTYPNNIVHLPSKGLLYPPENPLSKGSVEMKFMTTKEENILTTESYIASEVVIDKFLESMIVAPIFNYDTLLVGDKDALLLASRIYGHGEIYEFEVKTPSGRKQKVQIDLREIPNKEIDETKFVHGENRFNYKLRSRAGTHEVEFKLLTVGDLKKIDQRLKKFKTAGKEDKQVSTRLEQLIISIDGNEDPNFIRYFVENDLLARDSREFRNYVASIQPGPNMEIEIVDEVTGEPFRTSIALGPNFFWPDL